MTKTNTRSRIVSILLVLMMLLTMVPITGVTASAAEPEWTTVNSYAELQTAVKNKKEYIQLGRDIDTRDFHYSGSGLDTADWLTFDGQTCTLDLNGKTLSLMTKMKDMPTFMRVYDGSNLTIKDSQGGGQITGEFKNTGADDSYLIHMVKSSLTLEGGTFRATAEPYGTNVNVIGYLGSNVTIKDGVTISQPKKNETSAAREGHGYALCDDNINYGPEASNVVIDGGTFDGWVRLMGYQDTNDSVQINSGTFKKGVQLLYKAGEGENNSAPVVTVNGGTFEDNVYLNGWAWKMSLNMPYRLNGGTFYGSLNLCAETPIDKGDKPKESLNIALGLNECFTDSNLNHTGIYLYSKGKIMIHLTFDYKTDEKCTTPGQYLKYHRTFQGFTTRELAEKVGIVPATLVLYENDRHPIKHSTAVALANALGIDRNRLLDKYTAFVDYPYSSLLKKVRQELSLTQMQMAEVIGIGQTSYSGWEREIRVPRRKEYEKILAALKKLKVNVDTYLCHPAST